MQLEFWTSHAQWNPIYEIPFTVDAGNMVETIETIAKKAKLSTNGNQTSPHQIPP